MASQLVGCSQSLGWLLRKLSVSFPTITALFTAQEKYLIASVLCYLNKCVTVLLANKLVQGKVKKEKSSAYWSFTS